MQTSEQYVERGFLKTLAMETDSTAYLLRLLTFAVLPISSLSLWNTGKIQEMEQGLATMSLRSLD